MKGKKTMVEPADAKELIDEAIERAQEHHNAEEAEVRAGERRFRDRVSIMVGVLAVSLAIVHMAATGAARKSLLKGIEASDTFNYMQAKIIREAVFKTAGGAVAGDQAARTGWLAEAKRLRAPDRAGHGIDQLRAAGDQLREEGEHATKAGEGYELGETALQLAIVLLSIALVARSRPIVGGAMLFAIVGVGLALATAAGASLS
jgi:hypothetical protein